ncbi:MAG: barstar family protein [Clostridia bacterium]|nr:barstar family protein [Clostridia bacterium]
MVLKNDKFNVEIKKINIDTNDENFDYIYDFERYKDEELHSVLAIKIITAVKETQIALYCDFCGDYKCCTVLNNEKLLIAKFNTVYEINLISGEARYKQFNDLAGTMGLYKVEDGYIIHGEMEIVKLDYKLTTVWRFGGADIFASPQGNDSFKISNDKIELIDFENNHYTINLNGQLIEQFMKKQDWYNSFKQITESPIILNFAKCGNNLGEIHLMLKEKFGLPEYYGENWDALWDCLRYLFDDEITVELHNFYSLEPKLQDYCTPMLEVFNDVHNETPNFTYKIIS